MAQFIFFLVLIALPLGAYLVNAGLAQRSLRTVRERARAAGIKSPLPARREATITPIRSRTSRLNCGRDITHLLLFIVGAGGHCRFCAGDTRRIVTDVAPPGAVQPAVPEAADALAEVERMLEDRKP